MSETAKATARSAFVAHFGRDPQGIAFAPGRVNLIGDHVDYQDGLVLPMPVREGTAVARRARDDGQVRVLAKDMGAEDAFAVAAPDKPSQPDWRSYVRGMVALMAEEDVGIGADLVIAGDLPRGSGLSSSASLCVALGRALLAASEQEMVITRLARIAQRVEHDYAGVACGIMDQMAVAACEPGHALLLDCRDLSHRSVALPKGWHVSVHDSGVTRQLVDGAYNERRSTCETVAEKLGVASLRDAELSMLDNADLSEREHKRARHVISEIARVQKAADVLEAGDIERFGGLLQASHASLRDNFEVSLPAIDAVVEELSEQIGPQGGARMTGAGFGGSIVAVSDKSLSEGMPVFP